MYINSYYVQSSMLAASILYLLFNGTRAEEYMHQINNLDIQAFCRKYRAGAGSQHYKHNNVPSENPMETHHQNTNPSVPPIHTEIEKEDPEHHVNLVPEHHVNLAPETPLTTSYSGSSISAKYCPRGDKTLFIVGQDMGTVQDFLNQVLPNPSGTTSYTNIGADGATLGGLSSATDYGAGTIHTSAQVELVPGSILALGLYLVNALQDIASGSLDGDIDRLGEWIKSSNRPVLLRIGYEFDLPFNGYDAETYKVVFRKIVTLLRNKGVTNFVSVWQSSAWPINQDFRDWYPGDDVVDWIGTSWFRVEMSIQDNLIAFARSVNKPMIIAEAAPQGYDNEIGTQIDVYTNNIIQSNLSGEDIWRSWYQPLFDYIHSNKDVIRALAYINTPWKNQQMWSDGSNGYWGDSRVQSNGFIKEKFLNEIKDNSFWLLSGSDFSSQIVN